MKVCAVQIDFTGACAAALIATSLFLFLQVMDIPRLHDRLTAMIYRRRFEIELEELAPELSVLRCAMGEVRKSLKLKKIMLVRFGIYPALMNFEILGRAYHVG